MSDEGVNIRDLEISRPLNVHRSSNHPEVNEFVNSVYLKHFEKALKVTIKKKHIKVILLDLYVAWKSDPQLSIRVSRNKSDYKAKSRYNALHISRLTIEVIDELLRAGLIDQEKGFNDRERGVGRLTRIWPTPELLQLFAQARFGVLDIAQHEDQETIILRNDQDQDIEYREIEDITVPMRQVVNRYNLLLTRTFIDIPELDEPYINFVNAEGKTISRIHVSQSEKFVRRIFNRGDKKFKKGGRFYGGWWQRCPKEWRKKIYINDAPTNEIDYSGLHIVLLYALTGIDYWDYVARDPYTIPKPDFLESNEQSREVAKRLMLVAINAKNDKSAFQAFRQEAAQGSLEIGLNNAQLSQILNSLKALHEPISHFLSSDEGVNLMNMDSQITEFILRKFLLRDIPILTVHDSYIVPYGQEELLEEVMKEAFKAVTGVEGIKLKDLAKRFSARFDWPSDKFFAKLKQNLSVLLFRDGSVFRKAKYASMRFQARRAEGYKFRLNHFLNWQREQGHQLE